MLGDDGLSVLRYEDPIRPSLQTDFNERVVDGRLLGYISQIIPKSVMAGIFPSRAGGKPFCGSVGAEIDSREGSADL